MKSSNWLHYLIILLLTNVTLAQGLEYGRESHSSDSEKVVVIIIDGARYSETFGDTTRTYTPKMWELSSEGSVIDNFYNDSITYTSRAIPALWSGTWTDVRDTTYLGNQTKYSVKPSIFEYYRKHHKPIVCIGYREYQALQDRLIACTKKSVPDRFFY